MASVGALRIPPRRERRARGRQAAKAYRSAEVKAGRKSPRGTNFRPLYNGAHLGEAGGRLKEALDMVETVNGKLNIQRDKSRKKLNA